MTLFRIGVILGLFLPSLAMADWCEDEVAKLIWLEAADPVANAKGAIESGDVRLLATYGLGVEIPGIPEKNALVEFSNKNYRVIEGTGDDLCSDEHARLNNMAYKYATVYNRTLAGAN